MPVQLFDPVYFTGAMLLFAAVAIGMLFAPLLIGRLLRPVNPNVEKDAIYECGEPSIGPSAVQFDLRFYVVALLFIVFDVEVAFFFPWATVFGKATTLANDSLSKEQRQHVSDVLLQQVNVDPVTVDQATTIMRLAFMDLIFFFGVVLVGFAYIWKRGDLDWVRTVSHDRGEAIRRSRADPREPPAPATTPGISLPV